MLKTPTNTGEKLYNYDIEELRRWKNAPASAKLQWLADSIEFFGSPRIVVKD